MTGAVRRWPLAVIAAPAAVSIWSGWVGLGGLCGFGDVEPLPGILPLHVNTALTLPLGIESYAALALGAWLQPGTKGTARRFARGSALGALALGMLGQVSYHLLAARHATRAPDLVVVLVACLPVVVLGCAVALLHLLGASDAQPDTAPEAAPAAVTVTRPSAPAPRTRTRTGTAPGNRTRSASVTETDAELQYASEIAAGVLPSQRQIRADLRVGQDRARALRMHLESVSAN